MSFVKRKCRVIGCEKDVRNKGLFNGKTKYGTTCEMHHKLKQKLSPAERGVLVKVDTYGWAESRIQLINGIQSKRCSKCKQLLEISNFRKDSRAKTGLSPICKKCKAELYDKVRYKKGKEKLENNFLDLKPVGVHQGREGYRFVFFTEGITIPEHRWVMMKSLGRPLEKWEFVHHKNKDRTDNRLENLELSTDPHDHDVSAHHKASISSLIKENKILREQLEDLKKIK